MSSTGRPVATSTVSIASWCAFAMIATQVAGKAARDSLFLTNYHVSALPTMLIVSAAFSIVAALVASRAMTVYGPARVVPPCFIASGLLLLAEWWIAERNPRAASVIVYLHIAALGSILISGFWSLVDEVFDPRSAKRGIGRIMGGATAGGLFGGLVAERLGAAAGVLSILPVIAGLHFVCAFLIPRFANTGTTTPGSIGALFARHHSGDESGFSVLRRVGYLRSLALMVLLGNVAATLLDYLFKARATATFTGTDLVRFFALFYTLVSVLTLAVQTGMTRRLLESIGIARTVAVRPALVMIGGLVSLPVTGLLSVGIVRALEMVVQSSFFRAGYELLFTPVVPADKRRTKTIVDVGADRMGDIVGGALVRLVILLPVAFVDHTLTALVIVISLASLAVARLLHGGYVRALEQSLIHRAGAIDIDQAGGPGLRTITMDSTTGMDFTMTGIGLRLDELRDMARADAERAGEAATAAETPAPTGALPATDAELASLIELRSGDARRVHAELNRHRAITPVVATQLITLLAWDEMSGWASRALAKAAPSITGQLIDRMLDRDEEFAVRRRIPRILSVCNTRRAVDGLSAALADERFEVRYQAARALAKLYERSPALGVDSQLVYSMVSMETHVDRRLWNEQRLIDEPDATEDPSLIDASVRGRAGRRMEQVFMLLSLVLPREPLRIAFRGLLTTDSVLRATGLEYLESVLPREIWSTLHPLLDESHHAAAADRPREQALENLLRSSHSIELNLEEIRKNIPNG